MIQSDPLQTAHFGSFVSLHLVRLLRRSMLRYTEIRQCDEMITMSVGKLSQCDTAMPGDQMRCTEHHTVDKQGSSC